MSESVPLFVKEPKDGEPNPYLHLIEYHGIVLRPQTAFDVMTKVHQAHHFAIGMGRAEARIDHWHGEQA